VPDHVEDAAGAAKLTDFGGACLLDEDALTRTGDVLGTLAYMAPEQSEGREAEEEADLYALALVLYEALSGVNPVRGATPAETARRIGRRIEPLERRRGDLPRALTRALDTALAPSPHDRGTLAELRHALAAASGPRARARPALCTPRARAVPMPQPRLAHTAEGQALAEGEGIAAQEPCVRRTPALPRLLWLGCALALVVWQLAAGRPGAALLAAAALLPLLALPSRAGPGWLVCLLAPALGLLGLAGAYPAIAGQARRWRARAALAALGYWWLLLAEPLADRRLWLGVAGGTPARATWEGSLSPAAVHVVGPLLGVGLLLGAALWVLAAVVLPWLVRGRSAALDVVAATVWSAALVTAAPMLDAGLPAHGAPASPRGAVLGGVLGGVLAVAARALRGPV